MWAELLFGFTFWLTSYYYTILDYVFKFEILQYKDLTG